MGLIYDGDDMGYMVGVALNVIICNTLYGDNN